MPNYPGSLDDDISLFLAVNNARTRLTSSISISDLTIPVVTTSGFPNQGFVTILTNPDDITEAEAIAYVGVTATTFSGTERGAGGTPIFAHAVGNNVDLTVMAEHHNELKDAIIELEKIVGISGSHHFVPKDEQGNAIVSGTLTAENLLDAGWVTTSGSLVVCGPGFFKDDLDVAMDLVVSGTATFGVIPVAVQPAVQLVTNTGIVQLTSTSYVDTGCETAPLPVGHNLLFYGASAGGGSSNRPTSPDTNLKCVFAGVTAGENEDEVFDNNNPWGGTDLSGFKMVTGDGVNTAKLQGDLDTSSSSAAITNQSIMAIPFGDMGLVEGTDYWFANGSDSDTTVGTQNVLVTTLNATLPDSGDYIFFGSVEGEHQYDFRGSYWVNGAQKNTTYERSQGSGERRHFSFAQLQANLPAGSNTFEVKGSRYTTSSARFRRGRICIVRAASFDQVIGFRQNDNQATSSTTYAKVAPTEITYTPNLSETILVFANPTAFVSTLTGPPAVNYKLVDETAAVDLVTDISAARFRETDDKIPALLYSKLDNVFGPKTFSLSIREPEGTASSVEHETVNMLVWSMTLAGVSTPDTPVTTIAGNTITTHEINTDIINADNAIISTATVTGILDATLGQTIIGSGTAADFTVSTKLDVTGDLCVSGTAQFGQNSPVSAFSDPIFASNDVEQSTTSTSLVDTGCETAPLADGVEYLVIYTANTGNSSVGGNTAIRLDFGTTKTGSHDGLKSNLGSAAAAHYNDSFINGIVRVTGNGTDTMKFRYVVGSNTGYVGAQSILCVPLGQFIEGTDYYYGETPNTDTYVITSVAISDPPNTPLLTSNFTSMAAGDWLFMWSDEHSTTNGVGRAFAARFQVDGNTVGASRYGRHNDNGNGDVYNFAAAHVVNIPVGGSITAEILASSLVAPETHFRRGRIFAINTAKFNQVISTTDSVGYTHNSTSYQDFVGLNSTITPSQPNAPVIILSSATTYTQSSTSSALHAIRNETDGVDYRDDSGERNTAVGGLGATGIDLSSIFMVHFEERTALTEYRHQLRTPTAGNVSVGRNDDDTGGELSEMILWEFTPTAPFIPITSTLIDDDNIQTGTLIADTVTARLELTVSGAAPHVGDPLALQNLSVAEKLDVTGDLCVSGTAKFGQDDTPPSANGDVIFVSQDTEQTTASTTFVDANCETAPLLNGVEYLIIYAGNFGIDTESISVESQTMLGSTKIGRSGFAASALGTFGNNANNASYCHGIYRATGNGTDTVKFQFRVQSGTQTAYADAMSIICIPLDAYAQNTDYFWVETTNSDSAVVSNAAVIDPPTTVMLSNTFTSMDAGDWLFICSAEGNVSAGTTRGAVINFQVASTTIGTSRYTFQGRSFGSLTWNSVAVANMVNVAGGNTAVDILVASTQSAFADFFRGRIFAIKRSLFTQILSTTDTTGAATSSSSFVDFTPLDTTIVPTQPNSPIIVLTTAPSYTQQNDSGFTSAIRNETDATNYREDSGGREAERGGIGSADINLANSFMAHFEERTASTEYRYQYRTVGVGPVAVGRNEDDNGGEHSEMIVWEFLNSGAASVPITQTCIDDDQILTGTLIADGGTFNDSLTISGVPVSTGTGGGGAGGDFVAREGDSMFGNLDMAGNNIYNAGVVAMQDDVPVLTTSGLLWFDTDAPGHGDHGSAQLPGGTLAATVTTTTGLGVPDSVFQPNIPWDTEDLDKGGWYDPLFPQRLTVPSGVLYVRVFTNIHFEAENSNNRRQIQIYRNGNTSDVVAQDDQQSILNATYSPSLRAESPVLTVSGGDYFEVASDLNTNGGSLNILADTSSFGIIAADTRGVPGVNSINLMQGDVNITPGSGIAVNANSQTGEIEISLAQETRDLQIWSPDQPPASGTSFDSEWGDGNGTTGWTEWDVPSFLTVSTLPKSGSLRLKAIGTVAGVSGLIKTAPTSNFTIFTKLFVMGAIVEDFREFGIVLSDDLIGNPSTANFAVISTPFHEEGTDSQGSYLGFATQHFTDYNSFDRNLQFNGVQFPANEPIYVKVHVDVTTRIISTAASRDGLIWGAEITSDFSGDLTNITEMGYWIGNNTSTAPLTISSDFFRVVENVDHAAPLHGGFLTVSGVPQAIVVATGTQGGGGGSGDGNITDINAQQGPSVTVTGVGPIDVITTSNVLTITGTEGITDINEQFGPAITITGTAGIGVVTVGNVITIDGTEVQGSGGESSGVTISGCYTHYQSSASATWSVNHNLASTPVNYIVLDNANTEVIPNTFTVDDSNNVTITFVAPQTGRADIFPCVSGTPGIGITEGTATVSGCYSHVQTGSSSTWTVNHNLDTEIVNYVVLDNSGSQIQPDDFTIVNGNQITLDFVSPRVGIANIFACVDDDVIFNGGVFSNLVAVTGTFLNGITVGTGTTYITASGIDTPELKIAGETPNFGAEFSGYYLNPQAKPAVVHSASDWFDDNSGNPTLTGTHAVDTGKWTLWDEDGVAHASNGITDAMRDGGTPYTEYDTNSMRVIHDGSTIGGWLGYFQAAPAYDFTITARVSIKRSIFDGSAGGEENTMGIFIAEDLAAAPSTANLVAMGLHWDGLPPTSANWAVAEASEWSDFDTRTTGSEVNIGIQEYLWVRLWYRPSTDDRVYFVHSHDGITWSELRRTTPIGFTVGSIGFGLNSNKTFTSTGKIDFFAVASGVTSDRAAGHGRLIPLPV